MLKKDEIIVGQRARYRIKQKIGAGGLGEVWAGHDLGTGKKVAVKRLHSARFDLSDAVYERFVREVELGATLEHPNLVQVVDHVRSENDQRYETLVMEYVDGSPLSAVVGSLGAADRCEVALGIIDAVAYLHGLGLVHRDLKSNNVLIAASARAVVCDYGLLKKASDDVFVTNSVDKLGSLLYISSQQAKAPESADFRDDVYSLCVCLFELLSGQRMSVRWQSAAFTFGSRPLQRLLHGTISETTQRDRWPGLELLRYEVARLKQPTPTVLMFQQHSRGGSSRIRWQTRIGKQRWKNELISLGGLVIVGSAGSDDETALSGVYALDRLSGVERWRAVTPAPVNALAHLNGLIVFGCLDGRVEAVSAASGERRWSTEVGSAVVAQPIDVTEGILVFDVSGSCHLLEANTGARIATQALGAVVVANPTASQTPSRYRVFSREGCPVEIDPTTGRAVVGRRLVYGTHMGEPGMGVSGAATEDARGFVVQGYLRDSYFPTPPVVCVDWRPYAQCVVVWHAQDPEETRTYGNIRGAPLVFDSDTIICIGAYSSVVYALNSNGLVKWAVPIGREEFPQWASPVRCGDSVLIPRQDGFLHQIDPATENRMRSIYLGRHMDAGIEIGPGETEVVAKAPWWETLRGDPLVSPPLVVDSIVYQGSEEGWIYALEGLVG